MAMECLGESVDMQVCMGPDPFVSRELGMSACMTCVVPAYRRMALENELLREQAERDHLTTLLNRRMFDSALNERILASEPFGILFVDLEFFKKVNDREDHVGGDKVLVQAANYLEKFFTQTLRRDDIIARIGGDEFGIILHPARETGILDETTIEGIKKRLKENFVELPFIAEYNQRYSNVDPLALHVGHAIWSPGMSAEDLMSEADPPKREAHFQ